MPAGRKGFGLPVAGLSDGVRIFQTLEFSHHFGDLLPIDEVAHGCLLFFVYAAPGRIEKIQTETASCSILIVVVDFNLCITPP
jgi:hypothetical protein